MASDFLTTHGRGKRKTPRYFRWIPTDLQPLFNGKTARTKLLTGTPPSEVAEVIRAMQAADDKLFRWLRQQSAERKAAIVAAGGYDVAVRVARRLQDPNTPDDHIPEAFLLSDEGLEKIEPAEHDAVRLGMLAQLRAQRVEAVQREELKSLVLVAEPAPETSLDGLFQLWCTVYARKHKDQHIRTIHKLKQYLGNVDFRHISPVQCVSFCQYLENTGSSKRACINHMDALRGMLSAAVDKKIIPTNPAARVKPDGTIKVKDREPFTGGELQLILGMAAATRLGDDRHEAVIWALRLLVWTGARPREIFQLRKVDVRREAGIPMIDICEGHPLQSVKSGFARWVPLAPAVEGFLEYAANQPNEFVFGEFTHNPQKGRSHWLVNAFIEFRRKHITRDPLKTLYSIRHRFHDVLDNALVPEAQQFALVGHASAAVHRKYKKRPAMRLLYAAMCGLEPFED